MYPEVAWIYDPTRTPPNGASRPGDALLGGAAAGAAGGAAGAAAAHQAARDQQDSRAALLPGSSGTLGSSGTAHGVDPAAAALMHDTDHDHHPATAERDLTAASPRLRPISVSSPLYVPGTVAAAGAAAAVSTPSKGKDRALAGARSPPSSGSGSASGTSGTTSPRLTYQLDLTLFTSAIDIESHRVTWFQVPLIAIDVRHCSHRLPINRNDEVALPQAGLYCR